MFTHSAQDFGVRGWVYGLDSCNYKGFRPFSENLRKMFKPSQINTYVGTVIHRVGFDMRSEIGHDLRYIFVRLAV